jgi:hypothetical protein
MRVKWALVWLDVFYLFLVAVNLRGVFHPSSRPLFWAAVGSVAWVVLLGAYVNTREWPIISFPKPEAEQIDGATYTQPILAWRMWNINGKSLDSLHFNHRGPWLPKTQKTAICYSCTFSSLPMPHRSCSCGIYARKNIDPIFYRINKCSSPSVADPAGIFPRLNGVLGLVYLWGNILEGDDGYRAEFAYPAKLFIVDGQEQEIREIAERYGIPCQKFSWWQKRKFKNGGTRWISEKSKESLRSNLLSFLSPQNQSENQVA